MTIQILQYEFLGPIKISEWGPPMEEVVYLLFSRTKDAYNIIYVGESEKTTEANFFTSNERFKCWISNVATEDDLYLAIYPMWGSDPEERKRLVNKIVSKYNPVCNKP